MAQNNVSDDHVIAELVNMGFEFDVASKAVDGMGPDLQKAVDFILNAHCSSTTSQGVKKSKTLTSSNRMKQSTITTHFSSFSKPRRGSYSNSSYSSVAKSDICKPSDVKVEPLSELSSQFQEIASDPSSQCYATDSDWEKNVNDILLKHFGISSMKSFQKEALEAWLAHKDCLVLAATGSGKSLCFQIPAILTGKVAIVISPLISLMHDQCLKLSKHGIAACFLGSGQTDKTVEQKAMSGMYKIVYVCPETILRLMDPLVRLAENHGIALFAIDEVHCVSKWGHDFRPSYRRLSVLRKTFSSSNLKFLKFDIPIMALTATATIPVRDDILKSLHMSEEVKIVLTSFFRPNLRFSVKHSRTSSTSSYQEDFHELINTYALSSVKKRKRPTTISSCVDVIPRSSTNADDALDSNSSGSEDIIDEDYTDATEKSSTIEGCLLTAEYLEDDVDIHDTVDDFDVSCGEFPPNLPFQSSEALNESEISVGPTIIYVPTRKETQKIAGFLSKSGVKAAAYHAKLPKTHLRRAHQDFHQNSVEVVVATIAFGMGIDKSNVRRIIHYGWPQSLEAYYQEAGRAGRDGKLSDCTLYANLSRIPTLLPNKRSEEQTNQANKMLSECFRYGMNTATCRAKLIVNYFGEEFHSDKCHICDVCTTGPPEMQNLTEQAAILMHAIKSECEADTIQYSEYSGRQWLSGRRNFRMLVSKIREENQKYALNDVSWWRGLARILEDKGLIREATEQVHVTVKNPELTNSGLRFIHSESEQTLNAYPEADMIHSLKKPKPYSSFSEWGRGWADPEIRRQRLQGRKRDPSRKSRRKQWKQRTERSTTARGRISSKIAAKQKR